MKLGLIGQRLSHSYSKEYFDKKFKSEGLRDATYDLIEISSIETLPNVIERMHLDGFNVTIPYKQSILPMLHGLDSVAEEVGAVNTVKVEWTSSGDYILHGYNTDGPAFLYTLQPLLGSERHQALILGTGGAARAVSWALKQLGIEHYYVSRNPRESDLPQECVIGYDDSPCNIPQSPYTLLINATPVGMYPNKDCNPWPFVCHLGPGNICYDLIYNPSPTLLLKEASAMGATTKDGMEMLHLQADLAWQIWRQ